MDNLRYIILDRVTTNNDNDKIICSRKFCPKIATALHTVQAWCF